MIHGLIILAALGCGDERWDVKTLTDPSARSVQLKPTPTTVEDLVMQPAPKRWRPDSPRSLREQNAYTVSAVVVGYKLEADGDVHAVIRGRTGSTMIIEFPAAECLDGSVVWAQADQARGDFLALVGKLPGRWRRLRKPMPVEVTGVLFFDKLHGQTGAAPNGIELHPVTLITAALAQEEQDGP